MTIQLYYWPTPNGHKITIFLEEAAVDYQIHPVNIAQGDQFKPEFLQISPNNRMPAIVDTTPADGGAAISVFESGAILLYLAEKTGKFLADNLRDRTLDSSAKPSAQSVARRDLGAHALHGGSPRNGLSRKTVMEWLFWQVGGLGPMAGQNHHFNQYAPEKIPYACDRYIDETNRLYGVLNQQLAGKEYIAGEYSIADMACYPWIVPHAKQKQNLDDFPHLQRWFNDLKSRPAVVKAYEKGAAVSSESTVTEESKKILFGQTANLKKD